MFVHDRAHRARHVEHDDDVDALLVGGVGAQRVHRPRQRENAQARAPSARAMPGKSRSQTRRPDGPTRSGASVPSRRRGDARVLAGAPRQKNTTGTTKSAEQRPAARTSARERARRPASEHRVARSRARRAPRTRASRRRGREHARASGKRRACVSAGPAPCALVRRRTALDACASRAPGGSATACGTCASAACVLHDVLGARRARARNLPRSGRSCANFTRSA